MVPSVDCASAACTNRDCPLLQQAIAHSVPNTTVLVAKLRRVPNAISLIYSFNYLSILQLG